MTLAKIVKVTKCLARVVADLRVVALLLELVDHDDWNYNFLFFELEDGPRVTQ